MRTYFKQSKCPPSAAYQHVEDHQSHPFSCAYLKVIINRERRKEREGKRGVRREDRGRTRGEIVHTSSTPDGLHQLHSRMSLGTTWPHSHAHTYGFVLSSSLLLSSSCHLSLLLLCSSSAPLLLSSTPSPFLPSIPSPLTSDTLDALPLLPSCMYLKTTCIHSPVHTYSN